MLKSLKGLPAAAAASLLSFGAIAADIPATDSITAVRADGSYVVTDTLPPREACPGHNPTIVRHYLPNGLKQSTTSDLFCGSTVEKVFAADGSLRGSRRFERRDEEAAPRLTSVEFDNKGGDWERAVVLLSQGQQVQSVTVSFGARFHNVTLICNRQPGEAAWRIAELSTASGSHQVMTVPTLHAALPAEIPTSFAEIQTVWSAALAETAQVAKVAQATQQTAAIQPVRALSISAD